MNETRTLHCVIDLSGFGGAEMTLLRYLSALTEQERRHHHVLTFKSIKPGPSVGAEIQSLGISITPASITGFVSLPLGLVRLIRLMKAARPTLLSAWLYYPSLLVTLARPLMAGRPQIIWHIRSLPYGKWHEKPARWLAQRLLAPLSHLSSVTIASNSDAARKAHAHLGYNKARWQVIPNAIDTARYQPDAQARIAIRRELSISDDTLVIGAIGRNVPEKGFDNLIAAFGRIYQTHRDQKKLVILIAGRGISKDTPHLAPAIEATRVPLENFRLLETRNDIPALLNACDIFALSSRSESFPNVLAEAMATALPCVTTDVGDCRQVLADDRFVAESKDAASLAAALNTLVNADIEERRALGAKNRSHIKDHYTPAAMIARFNALFENASD
jgi:glycosyltransferase involved in cell wall biosynthesis